MDNDTKQEFQKVTQSFEKIDKSFEELVEIMHAGFRSVDERIDKLDDRVDNLYNHIDDFICLHNKVDLEVVAVRSYCQRLDERITKLEQKPA